MSTEKIKLTRQGKVVVPITTASAVKGLGDNTTLADDIQITNIKWLDLKTLRDSGLLIPSHKYRIIDYITSVNSENAISAGHQFDIIVTADSANTLNENASACQHENDTYFSKSKLNVWKIKYCLDNDSSRFNFANYNVLILNADKTAGILLTDNTVTKYNKSKTTDNIELETVYTYTNKSYTGNINNWLGNTNNGEAYLQSSLNEFKEGELVFYSYQGATPDNDELIKRTANVTILGHGVIYYLLDEFNNIAPYDFKNILFKRWYISETTRSCTALVETWGAYASTIDGFTIKNDTGNPTYSYRFTSHTDATNIALVATEEGAVNGSSLGTSSTQLDTIKKGYVSINVLDTTKTKLGTDGTKYYYVKGLDIYIEPAESTSGSGVTIAPTGEDIYLEGVQSEGIKDFEYVYIDVSNIDNIVNGSTHTIIVYNETAQTLIRTWTVKMHKVQTSFQPQYFYTFDLDGVDSSLDGITNYVHNNIIENNLFPGSALKLNNIVLKGLLVYGNNFNTYCSKLTLGLNSDSYVKNNTINSSYLIICNSIGACNIKATNSNIYANGIFGNSFGASNDCIYFGKSYYDSIGNNNQYIELIGTTNYNKIGDYNNSGTKTAKTITLYGYDNIIGNQNSSIYIGDLSHNNKIGSQNTSITLPGESVNNIILNNCNTINIICTDYLSGYLSVNDNFFGNKCKNINITCILTSDKFKITSIGLNIFTDDTHDITYNDTITATLGLYGNIFDACNTVTMTNNGDGIILNKIGKECTKITLSCNGNFGCSGNEFETGCNNITIASGHKNTFGIECYNITMDKGSADGNRFENFCHDITFTNYQADANTFRGHHITIGQCNRNTIYANKVTLGDTCHRNTIIGINGYGEDTGEEDTIVFGTDCSHNTINRCTNITFGNFCSENVLNNANYIVFGTNANSVNTTLNYIQNVQVNPGCKYVSISSADVVDSANIKYILNLILKDIIGTSTAYKNIQLSRGLTKTTEFSNNSSGELQNYVIADFPSLISVIPKFAIQVVTALPTTNISTSTVYLLANTTTTTNNLYTEYIYVNNAWEKLGEQTIDLTPYAKTADLLWITGTGTNSIIQKGSNSTASEQLALAEGINGTASGKYSHSEGTNCISSGESSHAEGNTTVATNNYEHAEGMYNVSTTSSVLSESTLHSIGIGTSDKSLNGEETKKNGDKYLYGIGGYTGNNFTSSITVQNVVNSKADKPIINRITGTSVTQDLIANRFYKFSTALTALTVTLVASSNTTYLDEYMFEFTSDANTAATLTVPSTVKWMSNITPVIEKGKTYQVSIMNNIAVIGGLTI